MISGPVVDHAVYCCTFCQDLIFNPVEKSNTVRSKLGGGGGGAGGDGSTAVLP